MTETAQTLTHRARALGLRMTGPRKVILEVLDQADDHPDVEEIHRRVALLSPGVNLATTYRTLGLLAEHGLVEKHNFADGRMRFETAAAEHHDHFIDVETGEIIEFHSEELEALQAAIAKKYGFDIVAHRLEIMETQTLRAASAHCEAPPCRGKWAQSASMER